MAIFGKYFTYNGHSSEEFNIAIGSFEQAQSIPLGMKRDVQASDLNRYSSKPNHYGMVYNETLEFQIGFIKLPCKDDPTVMKQEIQKYDLSTGTKFPVNYSNVVNIDITDGTGNYATLNDKQYSFTTEEITTASGEQKQQKYIKFSDELATQALHIAIVTYKYETTYTYNPRFTRSEIRNIIAWLTEPDFPSLFHMYNFETDESILDIPVDYCGVVTNIEDNNYNGLVGLTVTFRCDSPFGYGEKKTVTVNSTDTAKIKIHLNTDNHWVYPVMRVLPNDTNKITITNSVDNKSLTFTPYAKNDEMTFDNRLMTVTTTSDLPLRLTDIGISDASKVYWLKLFDGDNEISVTGNCTVKITYREELKVGAY